MEHIYINNNSENTLIMLHGTGGTEVEMANFGKRIRSDFNILSIRGNVIENGMNRYFKRFGMGSYDLESYALETKNLADAIVLFKNKYQIDLDKSFVVGFSNGANIALGLIQDYPMLVKNYILLSVDYINKEVGFNNLKELNILMSSSKNDPYTNFDNILYLQQQLINSGANLTNFLVPGHVITNDLLLKIKEFIKEKSGL